MIAWEPSIYVPGVGVVKLSQEDIDIMYPKNPMHYGVRSNWDGSIA